MNNAIDRITLDVHKAVSQVSLIWKRGDTARTIEASLTDNGKPFMLDGCSVSFTADGASPALHYCEIKDNRIVYEAAPVVTEKARSMLCEFRVIGTDGKVLTAPRFGIDVRDTVIDPDKVEENTTEAPTEDVTEAPTEEITEAPTAEATEAPTAEVTEPAESGCGATVSLGLVAVLAMGAVLTLKKKEK